MDERLCPIFSVDGHDGAHLVALAFDAGGPAIEAADTFCALQIGFEVGDDREAVIGALAKDGDVNLSLPRGETEGLADGDELGFLRLGELLRKARSVKVIEDSLLLDLDNWRRALRFSGSSEER